jgi:hypothetical protein
MQTNEGGRMRKITCYTGQELREMFAAAAVWLEKSVPDINALNVFPVPDGDCGTNMLLTMRSAIEEACRVPDSNASAVIQAMAHGALMGARGNSGVILSQIFLGLAQGLEGRESFAGSDFACGLVEGASAAYKALTRPVEGTILTVVRKASTAAQSASDQGDDLASILEAAVNAARDTVADTPALLPILREAGVVDAGGQGLYVVLDGALRYLKGEIKEMQYRKPQIVPSSIPLINRTAELQASGEEPYGYCTEFVLEGERLKPEKIKGKLEDKGQYLIVVGDEHTIHLHIHTFDPGTVIRYATSLGTIHQIKIQNMDDQHRKFIEISKAQAPQADIATVGVASGEGLIEVLRGLGAAVIVPGGQTMNPSTQELLQAVESVPQDKVIILPNNKNIIPTANQVSSLTTKKVEVVPTETIPQGVAALLSFNYDADLEANASIMEEARLGIKTVEVTQAVRSTQIGGLKIKKGQAISFLDGELVAVGDSTTEVLWETLLKLDINGKEVGTIYYGDSTKRTEAEAIADKIRRQYAQLEIELVYGGQPHYNYIVSVE